MLPENELIDFLQTLCDEAAQETLPRFRKKINIANKETTGFDPVTEGDKQAEQAIRTCIQRQYPDHGIIGEEYAPHNPDAPYQWIIDPIDGTRAFISGLPLWGTLIALYHNKKPIAGVMDQPFTGERYLATHHKAWLYRPDSTKTALSTSTIAQLSEATLMTTSPHLLARKEDQQYFHVEEKVKLFRYGADCYAYCLLASGHIDLVIESQLNIYDIAALIPIIENAGGLITDWNGNSPANGGQILASANATLHDQALSVLRSSPL